MATLFSLVSFYTLLHVTLIHPIGDRPVGKLKGAKVKKAKAERFLFEKKEGVTKDLWLAKTDVHLESPSSYLYFTQEGKKLALHEVMTPLSLWITEKSRIRFLHTEEATYHYREKNLLADEAFFSIYEGAPLKTKTEAHKEFTGVAKKVSFHFDTFPPNFEAAELKASIKEEGP